MLRAAALVPPTALLVLPGTATELETVRARARSAVDVLVRSGAERVVVVGPGSRTWSGLLHPTFDAAGIPDESSGLDGVVVGVDADPLAAGGPGLVDDVPAAVALALLAEAGWSGAVQVVGLGAGDAVALRSLGRDLVGHDAARPDAALLLVGGLSARRGPGAPLAEDPRARAYDEAVVADLRLIGRGQAVQDAGGTQAADRLAALGPDLARDLAVSAWGPWHVLLGALETPGPDLHPTVHDSVPAGATYVVATWDER